MRASSHDRLPSRMRERPEPGRAAEPRPGGPLRRFARKAAALVAGLTVLTVGVIISPLPGPGFTILGPLGLAILASQFAWAAHLLRGFRHGTAGFRAHIDRIARASPLPIVAAVVILYWVGAVLAALHTAIPQLLIWVPASFMFVPIFYWASTAVRCRFGSTAPQCAAAPPANTEAHGDDRSRSDRAA